MNLQSIKERDIVHVRKPDDYRAEVLLKHRGELTVRMLCGARGIHRVKARDIEHWWSFRR